MTWHVLLPITGLLIVSLGAYAAGGDLLSCAPVGSTPAGVDCRVETRRWFGLRTVNVQDYRGITDVEAIAEASTSTSTTPAGRTRTGSDDFSLRLLSRGVEVGRIRAAEDQVDTAEDRLKAWLEAGATRPMRTWLSTRTFAYIAMGFGVAWMLVTGFLSRLAAEQHARDQARPQQPSSPSSA